VALQPGHIPAQCLLGDVEPGGRPPEVQLLRDGHEVTHQPQVEIVRHAAGT
jgi:hypothetical protein